jgi:hypothetical protein
MADVDWLQFIHSLRTPMYQYLDFFMARDPVLEDWELMESARYCFKWVDQAI